MARMVLQETNHSSHLYVLLDVYSRYVVSWMLASCESEDLAKALLSEAYVKYGIQPGYPHPSCVDNRRVVGPPQSLN